MTPGLDMGMGSTPGFDGGYTPGMTPSLGPGTAISTPAMGVPSTPSLSAAPSEPAGNGKPGLPVTCSPSPSSRLAGDSCTQGSSHFLSTRDSIRNNRLGLT